VKKFFKSFLFVCLFIFPFFCSSFFKSLENQK